MYLSDMGHKQRKKGELKHYQLCIRISDNEKEKLEKECADIGLDVSAYARSLLFTHPNRKKLQHALNPEAR
jgi:hypothetical protein